MYVLIINVASCPPGALIWKIKYLVSCILSQKSLKIHLIHFQLEILNALNWIWTVSLSFVIFSKYLSSFLTLSYTVFGVNVTCDYLNDIIWEMWEYNCIIYIQMVFWGLLYLLRSFLAWFMIHTFCVHVTCNIMRHYFMTEEKVAKILIQFFNVRVTQWKNAFSCSSRT